MEVQVSNHVVYVFDRHGMVVKHTEAYDTANADSIALEYARQYNAKVTRFSSEKETVK